MRRCDSARRTKLSDDGEAEIPVFICYRRVDGEKTARRIYHLIEEQRVELEGQGVAKLDVYFDQTSPAGRDWRKTHEPYLKRSRAMILVCSPGVNSKHGRDDWVHREIDWWLRNRDCPPIAIEATSEGERWVPQKVLCRTEGSQRVTLIEDEFAALDKQELENRESELKKQLLNGIVASRRLVYEDELNREKKNKKKARIMLLSTIVLAAVAAFLCFKLLGVLEQRRRDRLEQLASELIATDQYEPQLKALRAAQSLRIMVENRFPDAYKAERNFRACLAKMSGERLDIGIEQTTGLLQTDSTYRWLVAGQVERSDTFRIRVWDTKSGVPQITKDSFLIGGTVCKAAFYNRGNKLIVATETEAKLVDLANSSLPTKNIRIFPKSVHEASGRAKTNRYFLDDLAVRETDIGTQLVVVYRDRNNHQQELVCLPFDEIDIGKWRSDPTCVHSDCLKSPDLVAHSSLVAGGDILITFDKNKRLNFSKVLSDGTKEPFGSSISVPYDLTAYTHHRTVGIDRIAVVDRQNYVSVWDGPNFENKNTSLQVSAKVTALALTNDAKSVVAGCDDGSIRILNAEMPTKTEKVFYGHEGRILALAPGQGSLLYSASADKSIRITSLQAKGAESFSMKHLPRTQAEIARIKFPASQDRILKAAREQIQQTLQPSAIESLSVTPESGFVGCVYQLPEQNTWKSKVWELRDEAIRNPFDGPSSERKPEHFVLSRDGKWTALTAEMTPGIELVRAPEKKTSGTKCRLNVRAASICFVFDSSRNRNCLAAVCQQRGSESNVKMWELGTSPDGKIAEDEAITLGELSPWKFSKLRSSADGKLLHGRALKSKYSKDVKSDSYWHIDTELLLNWANRVVGRQHTTEEWNEYMPSNVGDKDLLNPSTWSFN